MSVLTLGLLVAMVQNYICGVIHSSCQVLSWAFAELIHPEHVVVDVGDAVDVVFKNVDTEGLMELCGSPERTCYREEAKELLGWEKGGGVGRLGHSTVLKAVHSHDCVAAVQPHAANLGEFGVGPVQTLVEVVHGQTCREPDSVRKSPAKRSV